MTWFLESTFGKATVFFVDLFCGLSAKAFYYVSDDDEDA